ncbi:MAG: palindromic element RPE4 domain-containing protein [Rickettsia sp.]
MAVTPWLDHGVQLIISILNCFLDTVDKPRYDNGAFFKSYAGKANH